MSGWWLAAILALGTTKAREVTHRRFGDGQLRLVVRGGEGQLVYAGRDGRTREIACDRLTGAWGLWLGDVDQDGQPEAIVVLRKPARFDPVIENRLHVYHLVDGACVPAWRGTRLVGRFDRVAVDGDRLLVQERMGGARQRVAWYRWRGFGYAVTQVVWEGRGAPPASWREKFDTAEEADR